MIEHLEDADYWRALNPALSISTGAAPDDTPPVDLVGARGKMRREGYVVLPPAIPSAALDSVRNAMATVEAAGWLPVFSFLYDAPWRVSRLSPIRRLAAELLGPGFRQLPDFWAYKIQQGERGYRPHREVGQGDMLTEEGDAKAITVWVALTDATLDNSCIHVIPRHLEADALDMAAHADEYGSDGSAILPMMLHRVRALPVAAGSILSWHHLILHWGSFVTEKATHPRQSVSFEFIRGDMDPSFHPHAHLPADAGPHPPLTLDAGGPLPTFEQRVFFVARNIRNYRGRDEADPFRRIATHVLQQGYP